MIKSGCTTIIAIIIIMVLLCKCSNSDTLAYTEFPTIEVEPYRIEMIEHEPLDVVQDTEEVEEIIEETTVPNFHSLMSCDWSSEESYLLAKIAMAEAEGEDIEGKAYVMMVILNRMLDDEFPDTIEGVIYEEIPGSIYHQFSPIDNGRFDSIEPNEECWEALKMIMVDKWDKSQGALYFESCSNSNNWHSRNLEYLFTHGNHRFYK